ncbi:MAG: TadE/TadG family type IV pilus assembly protein [Jatrophihabitans sp.]|uniref:TadE/TadG family type IV pilus assembly protein n=1 Tax=Jatrophihabitans sp. TaxID=1932789 RepID=UPI003F7D8876
MRRRVAARGDDAGAAVVDFAMVAVLLVLLLMAVLQVAVYFYARTVVASATADAARYAAARGVSADAGAVRAQRLVSDGLDANDAGAIRCRGAVGTDGGSGLPVTRVRCSGEIRLLFLPLGVPLRVDTTSTVLKETGP